MEEPYVDIFASIVNQIVFMFLKKIKRNGNNRATIR